MPPTESQVNQFRGLVAELAHLCAEQRRIAEVLGKLWLVEDAGTAICNLELLNIRIRDRSLPSSKGMSLGIAKAIDEWGIDELSDMAGRVDDYYSRSWNW
jgi:hypothetical protein